MEAEGEKGGCAIAVQPPCINGLIIVASITVLVT